jgi:ferredoxin-NADP reductase
MSNRPVHQWRQAHVLDSIPVTRRVRRIVLGGAPGGTAAGSHLDFLIPLPAGPATRSYSIVDDGRHPGTISVAVQLARHSRGGSAWMHELRSGDPVTVSQPVQTFPLTPGRPHYLLLAGGIGITPLVSMARQLHEWGREFRLVYTGRNPADMPFADQLQGAYPGQVEIVLSARGRLDIDCLIRRAPQETELYVCGPLSLLHDTQQTWLAAGRAAHSLRFETFGSGGTLTTRAFMVRVPRLGIVATVAADQTAVEALEAARAEVMYDCLRGECGLCAVPVLGCDGELDHRDVFLSDRQKKAGDQLCLCVSRVAGGSVTIDLP